MPASGDKMTIRYIDPPPEFPYDENYVDRRVTELSSQHDLMADYYEKGRGLYKTYKAKVKEYGDEADMAEGAMRLREAEQTGDVDDLNASKQSVIDERDKLVTQRSSLIAAIEQDKVKRAPMVEDLRHLLALDNLGDYKPTLQGVIDAFRIRKGYEEIGAVRAEQERLKAELKLFLQDRPSRFGKDSPLSSDQSLKHHLPTILVSILPGALTGMGLGTLLGVVKPSELARGIVGGAAIGFAVVGIFIVSWLSILTEKVVVMSYDDHRKYKHLTKLTIGTGILVSVLIVSELCIDASGALALYDRLADMYDFQMPRAVVLPMSVLLGVLAVCITFITTIFSNQKRLASAPDLDQEEADLRAKLLEVDVRLKKADADDTTLTNTLKDRKFGPVLAKLKEIENIDSLIAHKKEEADKIDQKCKELEKDIKGRESTIYARSGKLEVDPDVKSRFQAKRAAIQEIIDEAKLVLG